MHLAALRGHKATVVQLENQGGCVNAKGQNGWTPLHLACHQSEPEMVASLLGANADPNVPERPLTLQYDSGKNTPGRAR
ncbi:hypothetical protein Q5P01_010213 [Channa striata]|uniref:Uncharacterized protein n=1 Tax=Channa striata TaxID=64152 RepID=A0AA88MXI8_CHASR|nr:hypothetical protein Q5P01_010213 [Channa striata]